MFNYYLPFQSTEKESISELTLPQMRLDMQLNLYNITYDLQLETFEHKIMKIMHLISTS